jgi:hypothetical protein
VILLEIETMGVAVLKLEGYAPGSINVNRKAGGFEAAQCVEVEPGDVHLFWALSYLQPIETTQDAWVHLHVNPSGSAAFPELGKPFIFEAPDHDCSVSK